MTVAEVKPTRINEVGRRPVIVTIFNQKGGIGKTTTAINLSVCLAALGHEVVLVDLDSQSNATTGLGVVAPPTRGAYELISGTATLGEIRKPTAYPNLFVCGASDELAGADIELAMVEAPQHRLAQALATLPGAVEFVVVDCPPALGMLPVNALVACDWVLLPVTPEPMARDGLAKAWRHIQRIRANLNRDLEVAGILLTMERPDELHDSLAATIRAEFGQRVLPMAIPYDLQVVEASSHDIPVAAYAPDSPAAIAYLELARLIAGGHGAADAHAHATLWNWSRHDRPAESGHGDDPEVGWAPVDDPAELPVVPGLRWKIGVAVLLFMLGGLIGFVAGSSTQ